MSDTVRAYIAGLIDGEGCISIGRHKTGLTIGVAITMTNADGIDLIRRHYGGKFQFIRRAKNQENWKPVYMWRVEARKAERLLRDIQPYLLVKREQCALALAFRDHMHAGGVLSRGPNYKPDSAKDVAINEWRESAKRRMHELNRRGVN